MGYFLRSESLSTCAGLTFPLRDVREFSSRTPSVSIEDRTKKIFGVNYKYKVMHLKNLALDKNHKEDWYAHVKKVINPAFNRGDDAINSTAFRAKIGNLYFIYNLFNSGVTSTDVFSYSYGFADDNKKEGRKPAEYYLSIGTAPLQTVNQYVYFTGFVDNNNELWFSIDYMPTSAEYPSFPNQVIYFNLTGIGSIEVIEKSEEYGNYSESGGYGGGSFDDSSDAFGLPSLPSLGVSEVGFINVYNPSKGQLQGFADELFPNFEMPTPSTATGIEAVAENLANTFEVLGDFAESYVNAGLINYVIDCHIVPVAPVTNGTSNIKVGFKTFNYSPAKVTSDYVAFDCGSLEIAEYYQNFLDYEGTKAKLYLPFIGFVDIKPEWFQSGKLGVTYHFNIIDGSCIAFVIATSSKSNLKNTVVATFGGNCCVHMPITGVNYSSMISGVVGGAVGIASNASNMIKTNRADKGSVMSNIEGATGIASNLADVVGAKPSIEQSNGYNAGMSFMCYRRPYLLIERPVASFSKDYPREQGLPLNVTKKLGSMKGFTTCTAPVVDNFHCLEEEKEMIKQALIEGTIF